MEGEEKNLYLEFEREFQTKTGRKPKGYKELYMWLHKIGGLDLNKLVEVERERRITGTASSEELRKTPQEIIMESLPLNVFRMMRRSEKRKTTKRKPSARRKPMPRHF